MSDRVVVRGVQVFARHGLLPEEEVLGGRFVLDITAFLDLGPAGRSDDMALGVSYADLVAVASGLLTGTRFRLIEAAAEAVAAALLGRFPAIDRVEIELHKPSAPVPAIFSDVSVVIARSRRRE